jgi:hypothetical protein
VRTGHWKRRGIRLAYELLRRQLTGVTWTRRLRRAAGGLVLAAAALLVAGCDARLPDPESPGARVYAARCGGCHRIYAPESMTSQMWKITVARMQGELARRGLPVLSEGDQGVLLDYLGRNSLGHEG